MTPVVPDGDAAVLGAIALGGAVGAVTRHVVTEALPTPPGSLPVATFVVNVVGSALMGVVLAVLAARQAPRLWRPFLGTGILGGFTTMSAFALDAQELLDSGAYVPAVVYVGATPLVAILAFGLGAAITRRVDPAGVDR